MIMCSLSSTSCHTIYLYGILNGNVCTAWIRAFRSHCFLWLCHTFSLYILSEHSAFNFIIMNSWLFNLWKFPSATMKIKYHTFTLQFATQLKLFVWVRAKNAGYHTLTKTIVLHMTYICIIYELILYDWN